MLTLYGEGLLAAHPTSKLDDQPWSFVHSCLFNTLTATLHCWRGRPCICNLRTCQAVVTGHTPNIGETFWLVKKYKTHEEEHTKSFISIILELWYCLCRLTLLVQVQQNVTYCMFYNVMMLLYLLLLLAIFCANYLQRNLGSLNNFGPACERCKHC
jgi:hypothetical protein